MKNIFFKRTNYFFALVLICLIQLGFSQNNNLIQFQEETLITQDSCLTNRSNYANFKLILVNENQRLDSLKIQVETLYKNQEFTAIEAFNTFDFKFWLLSNDSFKYKGDLKIRITYIIDDQTMEQVFVFCLDYASDAILASDRGGKSTPDYVKLPIYFGTDRNYTASQSPNDTFGTERSLLTYGLVEVSIPHDHRVGEIETPKLWKFEFSEDPSKHIMLHKIDLLEKEKFFSKLADGISKSEKKSTFLFVHGYNTSFSEAAKRTAQISYDLKFNGKAVFYSWPSKASTFHYRTDERNIAWSRKNLKLFLEDYLSISEAEEIYLVAHSMGNRSLTQAIIEVMDSKPELRSKIKEIILAAPDIDAEVFKNEIAPQMVSTTQKPITLYVSADDLALKASKLLHGKPRAGDAGIAPLIIKGVETIDATGIDTSFLSHSYFADSNSIISDIFDLIESGKRALQRQRLDLMEIQNQVYFKVKQ